MLSSLHYTDIVGSQETHLAYMKNIVTLPLLIFTAQCYGSSVYAVIICRSVCVCVCHTPVLYQNG